MPDLAPTTIFLLDGARTATDLKYGETIAILDVIYRSADGTYWKIQPSLSQAEAATAGIALVAGIVDTRGVAVTSGPVVFGGVTMTQGHGYFGSDAGKIRPQADINVGDWVTLLGNAATPTQLVVDIANYGHQA